MFKAVRPLFAHTDFAVQKPLLRAAVDLMIRFGRGETGTRPEMERLARRHGQHDLNIDRAFYDAWLDTLCDVLAQHDPQFGPSLEGAWRDRMRPGIEPMQALYAH